MAGESAAKCTVVTGWLKIMRTTYICKHTITAIQDCLFCEQPFPQSPSPHNHVKRRHRCPSAGLGDQCWDIVRVTSAYHKNDRQQLLVHVRHQTWREHYSVMFVSCLSFCSTDSGNALYKSTVFYTTGFPLFLLRYILPVTIDIVTVGIAFLVLCVLNWVLIFPDNEFRHQKDCPRHFAVKIN